MRRLTLFPHEIRRLLAAGRVLLVRPVKPQPERSSYWTEHEGAFYPNNTAAISHMLRCPYDAPGSVAWVRETWGFSAKLPVSVALSPTNEMVWIAYPDLHGYKADNPPGNWCWRSPVTMPRWASRLSVVVQAVAVKRVDALTPIEIGAAGFDDDLPAHNYIHFQNNWLRHYARHYPDDLWQLWCWCIDVYKAA